MTLVWHGNKVQGKLRDGTRAALTDVVLVERYVKGSMKEGGRTESGAVGQGEKVYKINTFRSKPGEVPRVQFGTLKRSIMHELHPTLPIARVGTNVVYGRSLEMGTKKVAARPFMRPAMMAMKAYAAKRFRSVLKGKTI